MSSHPETRERIRIIRTEIDKLGAKQWKPIDVDWEAAQAACDPMPSSDTKKTARDFANPEPEPAVGGPSRAESGRDAPPTESATDSGAN